MLSKFTCLYGFPSRGLSNFIERILDVYVMFKESYKCHTSTPTVSSHNCILLHKMAIPYVQSKVTLDNVMLHSLTAH